MSKYQVFEEKEMQTGQMFPPVPGVYGSPTMTFRKFDTPITPKENFMRFVKGEEPAWAPLLQRDVSFIQPMIYPDNKARTFGGVDAFGIEWVYEEKSAAAMVKPGTRRLSDITEWENEIVFPDLSAIDWQKDYEENFKDVLVEDKPVMFVILNGLFERTADLTSFEDTFCYLLEEEEALEAFYTKLTDYHIELMKIAKEVYHADIITFHDDMGTQKSSFFSPDTFREVMMPHYKRTVDAAHEMGLIINFHSCGCIANQIPNIIECGFDIWEGQTTANDKATLIKEYGDKIKFLDIFDPGLDVTEEEFDSKLEKWTKDLLLTKNCVGWFFMDPVHN
ncbi:uroporphyrinogen decarboxylase family protein, partial [Intestinibacter sp.]